MSAKKDSKRKMTISRKSVYGVLVAAGLLVLAEVVAQIGYLIVKGEMYYGLNDKVRNSTVFSPYTLLEYPANSKIFMAGYPGYLETDRYGFIHNGYDREITGDDFTLFVLGGSTVEGRGASSNSRTICAFLERFLRDDFKDVKREIKVINAGRVGFNSYQEFDLLSSKIIQEFHPDLVLTFDGRNDAYYLIDRMGTDWKPNWQPHYDEVQHKVNTLLKSPIMGAWSLTTNYLEENFLLATVLQSAIVDDSAPVESTLVVNKEVIVQSLNSYFSALYLAHFISQWHKFDYVAVLQPVLIPSCKKVFSKAEQITYDKFLEDYRRSDAYSSYLEDFYMNAASTHHANRWCCDMSRIFLDSEETLYFDSCHYNDKGNELIARELAKLISPIVAARINQQAGDE